MLSRISVRKPFTVLVGVVLVLVLGFVSITSMTTDLLPSMNLPYALIMTTYVGASPESVETTVTSPIEQTMATVSNIENITSVSNENYSMVILEFNQTTNMDSVTIEMRENLDQIGAYWPDGVGSPIIMKLNPDMLPVMIAAVGADGMDNIEVSDFVADKIIPDLESIEGVASVSSTGEIEESIQVVIYQEKIDKINAKVRAVLDGTFEEYEEELQEGLDALEEGEEELNKAKDELESGKKELENGKKTLAEQLADAEKQINDGQNELILAEIELNNQLANLEDAETQLKSGLSTLQTLRETVSELESNKAALEAQRSSAETEGKAGIQQIQSGIQQLEAGIQQADAGIADVETKIKMVEAALASLDPDSEDYQVQTATLQQLKAGKIEAESTKNALIVQKTELETQLVTVENQLEAGLAEIDGYLEQINSGLAEIDSELAKQGYSRESLPSVISELQAQQKQLTEGKAVINQYKSDIASGKKTASEGLRELSKNRTLASIEMAEASSKIQAGEAALSTAEEELENGREQLENGQEELEKQKENAYDSADVGNILTTSMIETILQAENFSMPAGYITDDDVEYLVRVGDKLTDLEDLQNLVVLDMGMDDLDPIKLSEVADVFTVDNTDEVYAKLNGKNAIMLTMQKQTDYSTGDVSGKINDKFEELMETYDNVNIVALMDQGVYIDLVVGSVVENMLFGGALAVIILLLFLKDLKPTIVIAFSIPISLLTAIVLMYFSGVTLNIISLSGLALGIGMLVDNSIVVIENIYRLRNEGVPVRRAAVEGAREVGGAIFASTLTTVSVFLPIVFTTGITRQLFVDMGLTIAYSLLASLVIALTLVPAMAAGMLKNTSEKESKILNKIAEFYGKSLRYVLKYKVVVLIVTVVLFILSTVLILAKGMSFMPDMDSTQITVSVTAPEGSDLETTASLADEVADRILELDVVESVGAMMGSSSIMSMLGSGSGGSSTEEVSMYVLLDENKNMSGEDISHYIMENTEDLDCEVSVETSTMDLSVLGGSGLSVRVTGRELDTLQEIAADVAELIAEVEGTDEVSDGMEETTEEFRIIVDKAKAMGYQLTVAQVFQEIYGRISESTSATTIAIDSKDYDVFVLDNEDEQMIREELKDITFTYTDKEGEEEEIPLSDIADFTQAEGLSSISRSNQTRYIDVSATLEDGYNLTLVSSDVQKVLNLYDVPNGYAIEMTGGDQTVTEAMGELVKMLALAVVFIYLIMVAQFQSLLSPFIIMFTIPLAFTGGFFGLLITGNDLSVIAMIGFVMLAGIIVNNGIVLVDYINQLRIKGMKKEEAIMAAGRTRLRPILMTALTTILGLSTMALGMGMGADMVQPMAIVTIGGLIYGTLLTLLVVPCIYDIFNRKKEMSEVDLDEE